MTRSLALLLAVLAAGGLALDAQTAVTPREQAPRDIAGYWVSIITEDWHWRMVIPRKGDYASLPLNDGGRRAADAWSPAPPNAADACKPFGAAAIMRVPGRVRISWDTASILKIETDAGTQTRLLRFGAPAAAGWRTNARGEVVWVGPGAGPDGTGPPPSGPRDWQGYSVARWDIAPDPAAVRALPFFPGGVGTGADGAGIVVPGRFGSLHVETSRMKAGFLRRNGVPYSENAVLTEDFDFRTEDNGTQWFTVTTVVEDPTYLSSPFVTSSDFRKEPDGSKWRPTPCAAY